MSVKGVFASDSGFVGERSGDFAGGLLRHQPNGSAMLLALSAGMKSADAVDVIITWFEENYNTGRVSITNNASTGTSFTVSTADANNVTAGQIYMVEDSGEYVYIEGVTGTTVTVARGFAGTTNTSVDGSSTAKPMQLIGTAFEEGSAKPTSIANLGYPVFNYTQIFRNPWDITGTAAAVDFRTGDKVAKNKQDAANFHGEAIERSFLWGRKTVGIRNGKPFRTMQGIIPTITTNVETQSTSVKYVDMRNFLQNVFTYNVQGAPNERIAFCGHTVLGVLDTLAMQWGDFKLEAGQTSFGMNITKWMTPFGTISLMTHPLMNINPVWTKELYVLHPAALRTRWLRRTFWDNYDSNGTTAGTDAQFGVLTSELSMEVKAEKTMGKFTGIDAANVSSLQ